MTDFKIRKGLSTDLFIGGDHSNGIVDGVVLEKGSWYLCTDTAKLFLCVQTDDGLVLKRINDENIDELKHEVINTVKPSVDTLHTTVQTVILPKVETVEELRTWIENKEYLQDIDLEGFATEEFVTQKIAEAALADKEVDLSAYYTKSEVDAKIPSLDGYAKTEDIPTDYLKASDLDGYSKFSGSYTDLTDKPEIPSVDGLASEEYVDNAINNIPEVDLSNHIRLFSIEAPVSVESRYTDILTDYLSYTGAKKLVFPYGGTEYYASYLNSASFEDGHTGYIAYFTTHDGKNFQIKFSTHNDNINTKWKYSKELKTTLATEVYVDTAIAAIDIPSVEGLASEQFVLDKIDAISVPSIEGFATEHYVAEKIAEIEIPDVTNFATKEELPSVDGLATETFVHEMIAKAELDNEEVDLEAYYTKEQVNASFATKAELPSIEGLASEDFVTEKIAEINIPSTDGFATEQFVTEQISAIEIPSIDGLASEQFVKDSIAAIPAVDLSNYYSKSETETLISEAVSGIEIPDTSAFVTMKDVEAKGYLTEHQDISGKADKEHAHSINDVLDYVAPDFSLYYTKAEVDLRIPNTSNFIKEIPSEYITESELEAKGFITDVSDKADKNHKHDDLYETKGAAEAAAKAVKDELLNGAGSTYDTLKELSDLIRDNAGDIKSLESIATGKADKDHTHAQYITEHQDLSEYAKKSELPSIEGLASEDYVNKAISNIEIPEVPTRVSEFTNDAGYITLEDVPETDLSNYYNKSETETLVNDAIANIEHPTVDLTGYAKKSEIPSIDGLATEKFVKDEINKIVIPEATDLSNYYNKEEIDNKFENIEHPTVNFDGYATETWVSEQGFITNVDDKADVNHTHDEYLTSDDLAGYSKFSGSYNDLTDKPEIPSLVGYALKSEVALKADAVPFTTTNLVTNPIGSFAAGDDVAGLTIAQILAKLLGLTGSAENPDTPDTPDVPTEPNSIIDEILTNKTPLYQINESDEIVEVPYIDLQYNVSNVATTKDGKTGFYTVLDETGKVEEAGYQHFTVKKDPWYIVALPETLNVTPDGNVELKTWNGIENKWTAARYVLTGNYDEIVAAYNDAGITPPVAPDGYRLWADLSDSDPGTSYRFIIKE